MTEQEIMERFAKQMCEKDKEIADLRAQLAEKEKTIKERSYWTKELWDSAQHERAVAAESRAAELGKRVGELEAKLEELQDEIDRQRERANGMIPVIDGLKAENASLVKQLEEAGRKLWNELCHAGAADGDGGPAIPEPCDCRGCQAEYKMFQAQAALKAAKKMLDEILDMAASGEIHVPSEMQNKWQLFLTTGKYPALSPVVEPAALVQPETKVAALTKQNDELREMLGNSEAKAAVIEAAKALVDWKRRRIAGDEFDPEELVKAVEALSRPAVPIAEKEGGRP